MRHFFLHIKILCLHRNNFSFFFQSAFCGAGKGFFFALLFLNKCIKMFRRKFRNMILMVIGILIAYVLLYFILERIVYQFIMNYLLH